MSKETETQTPLAEAVDGMVITEEDLEGAGTGEVDQSSIISFVMEAVEAKGYKLEGRGRATGGQTFHIGGEDEFEWSDMDDNKGILIEKKPIRIGMYTIKELLDLGDVKGTQYLQDRVTEILSGLAEVSVERADKYFKALGEAYKEYDEYFCEARSFVLEESDDAEEMTKIDDDLYGEVYDRLQIPKDNPDETLIFWLAEAWDEGLEQIVTGYWVPEVKSNEFEPLPEAGDATSIGFTQEDLDEAQVPGIESFDDIPEMSDDGAAMLAGSLYTAIYGIKVENQHCSEFDHGVPYWQGFVNEMHWRFELDGDTWLFCVAHSPDDL